MKVPENLDYLIVLGAHVDGTRLTLALLERTRRALEYLKANPGTKAVLSGGKGKGEKISEARAMYDYLTANGIEGSRLILEARSVNTKENLSFRFHRDMDHCGRSYAALRSYLIFSAPYRVLFFFLL